MKPNLHAVVDKACNLLMQYGTKSTMKRARIKIAGARSPDELLDVCEMAMRAMQKRARKGGK